MPKRECFRCGEPAAASEYCWGCHEYLCGQCDRFWQYIPKSHTVWQHFECEDCRELAKRPESEACRAARVERALSKP
jgi:hypothetical protein